MRRIMRFVATDLSVPFVLNVPRREPSTTG